MKLKIICKNLGREVEIEGGSTLMDIAASLAPELGFRPICARVNNKTEGMDYAVYRPKLVEFMDRTVGSGPRVYLRSLCMLLYRAISAVIPGSKLRIEHSVSHGYYGVIKDHGRLTEAQTTTILREMRRLSRMALPFVRHEVPAEEAEAVFQAQGLEDKLELISSTHPLFFTYYTLDGISDSYYGTLAPATDYIDVFDIKPYADGFLLLSFDPADPSRPAKMIEQRKMFRAFTDYLAFNRIIGVGDVGRLNMAVRNRRAADIINVAEALHEKSIARISEDIAQRYAAGGARIVLISGPSSSGKTTTTKRLGIQLMTNLLRPQLISLDDYFVNRQDTPRDADGDYDYESLYALDLDQFNKDLNDILAGKEVEIPSYNFELGCRQYKGNRVKLGPGSILLVEGIHGLNPELTKAIPERAKYRLYVSALTTLSIDDHNWVPTTDNRLLRRIIRDYKYRGTSAEETIRRWPSVRRGEEKWIFPYQENADAMFNSSLIFELGVIRDYADNILRTVPNDVPEYAEAYRLRKFLSYFLPIGTHLIPSTSLLREFLGGSSFKY